MILKTKKKETTEALYYTRGYFELILFLYAKFQIETCLCRGVTCYL